MPYSNSWEAPPETQPLGSANSDTIDEIIRQLRLDIRERMNTILDPAGQWHMDPIALPDGGGGGGGGGGSVGTTYFTQLYGSHHIRAELAGGSITDWQDGYVNVTGNGKVPISVDGESTIQALHVALNPAAATVTCTLMRGTYLSSSVVPIGTIVPVTGAGWQIATLFTTTDGIEPVNAINTYHVKMNGTGEWQFAGLKVIAYRSIP